MKKSLLIGIVVMSFAALPLFAHGQKENSGAATASSSTPSGSITVFWWGSPERNAKTDAVINLFRKAYPSIHVSGENEGWTQYWQKVTVEASAHTLPCATQMQARQMLTYTNNGVFAPLDGLISSGAIDVSKMPKAVLLSGTGVDGKIYMIPYGAAYDDFTYNKTMADKAGLPTPPPGYTWSWFENWLKEAKAKLPAGVWPIMQNGSDADIFISYAESHGYPLFDKQGQLGFPQSLLRTYWSIWLNFAKEGIAIPEDLAVQEALGSSIEQSYLVKGKVMVEGEPGNQLPEGQKDANQIGTGTLAIITHPFGPKGMGNVLITNGFSIPTSCTGADRNAAAAFINFFTNNPAGAKVFASDNGTVTDTSLLEAQINSPSTSEPVKESLQLYEFISKHNPPVVLYPPGYTAVFSTLYAQIFQEIASGKMTLDQGVQSFFSQAKQQLSS